MLFKFVVIVASAAFAHAGLFPRHSVATSYASNNLISLRGYGHPEAPVGHGFSTASLAYGYAATPPTIRSNADRPSADHGVENDSRLNHELNYEAQEAKTDGHRSQHGVHDDHAVGVSYSVWRAYETARTLQYSDDDHGRFNAVVEKFDNALHPVPETFARLTAFTYRIHN